ncbi:MAG: Nucleotidyltransferase domain protein [Candidatus Diapherotrites archaeon ADurb.Bin253]|nr:MAG: Nucleotidyltransferase domain protein [Candidatus Diapherotrites archaeon ADurb.Bin253]HOH04257.1 nucleotidyltransferase domain-containing protein [Candidatus Pacearchaeota archaeon]HPX74575.1 nucleotidyltransferase domain-containing protein [Candidatus Pacearchaeota archaeon]HQC60989.1 nucleotidyltransferase domain-containing protein [Candidatus Pacearchaeota archaeon]
MDTYKLKFTQLEQEIFSFLCLRAGEKLSQREIAQSLKVSPTAIAKSLKKLLDINFARIEKTKTINFISLNRDKPLVIELKRAENLKNIYLSGLSDYLGENLAGSTIILFGSYARGEDTNTSDIDIAIIERKEKKINLAPYEKRLNKKININFYNSWNSIHISLKNNILNGIVLHGSVNL